jgi:hypothetical protein
VLWSRDQVAVVPHRTLEAPLVIRRDGRMRRLTAARNRFGEGPHTAEMEPITAGQPRPVGPELARSDESSPA